MLSELSKEQKKIMIDVRNKWITKLSFFKEIDKDSAIKSIGWLYNLCGFKSPKIIKCSSPYEAQLIANKLHNNSKKLKFYDFSWYGSINDYGWVSFYDFFYQINLNSLIKNKPLKEKFDNFISLLDTGIYDMIQFENICIICELPIKINKNDKKQLHSLIEPAIQWRDGWKLYYIDGINFSYEIWKKISNQTITAKEVLNFDNIEKRTLVFKLIGWNKVLQELQSKTIATDEYGELIEIDLKDDNKPARFLKFKDPSKNDEIGLLRTKPDCKTPKEAESYSYRLNNFNIIYKPVLRT